MFIRVAFSNYNALTELKGTVLNSLKGSYSYFRCLLENVYMFLIFREHICFLMLSNAAAPLFTLWLYAQF